MSDADVGSGAPPKARHEVGADTRGETTPPVRRVVVVGARTGDEVRGGLGWLGVLWSSTRSPYIVCTGAKFWRGGGVVVVVATGGMSHWGVAEDTFWEVVHGGGGLERRVFAPYFCADASSDCI